jgi:hypothetical protein
LRTGGLVGVFALNLQGGRLVSAGCSRVEKGVKEAYSGGGGLLVAGLASHLEGDAIGSGVLELEGGSVEVVEVLVEELEIFGQLCRRNCMKMAAGRSWNWRSGLPFDRRISCRAPSPDMG